MNDFNLMLRRLAVALFWLIPLAMSAQEHLDTAGRFASFHTPRPDVIGVYQPSGFFFRDSLTGFLTGFQYPNEFTMTTTDGGVTWTDAYNVPIPHRRVVDSFWIAPSGSLSTDGGWTWRKAFADTAPATTAMNALDRTHYAVIAKYPTELAWYGVHRLLVTTDGGRSWMPLDSARPDTALMLRRGPFGDLPVPEGMTNPKWNWRALGEWTDRGRFRALLTVEGRLRDTTAAVVYIATIDLARRSMEFVAAPNVNRPPRFVDSTFAWYSNFRNYWERDPGPQKLFWSLDAGHTWDSIGVPAWLNQNDIRMLTRDRGLALNGYTTDRGRSWTPLMHGYYESRWNVETSALVASHDLRTFNVYLQGPRLFGRSVDGGRTWSHTVSDVESRCMAVNHGIILIGRDYRSLLRSTDSAEHWELIGPTAGLPNDLLTVWGLHFPDTSRRSARVIGIASFLRDDRTYEVRQIESSDTGRTFVEAARMPVLEDYLATVETGEFRVLDPRYFSAYAKDRGAVRFVNARDPDGSNPVTFLVTQAGLLATTDGGQSWQMRCDSIPFARVTMRDSRNGIGFRVHNVARSGGLYYTTDGGWSWTWSMSVYPPAHTVIDIGWLGGDTYLAVAPHLSQYQMGFTFLSTDAGRSWELKEHTSIGRALNGALLWLDTNDLHAVPEFDWVMHSTDGGTSFNVLHASNEKWYQIPRIVWAYDGVYIYALNQKHRIGRWRVAQPLRARQIAAVDDDAVGAMSLSPNPATDATTLRLPRGAGATSRLAVHDPLGRLVTARPLTADEVASGRARLDLRGLQPGAYLVRLLGDGPARTLSLLVNR